MIKERKGITLIALVITIIVMLLLAGVTIMMVVNSGLFGQATRATTEMDIAQAEEALTAELVALQMEHRGSAITREMIRDRANSTRVLADLTLDNIVDNGDGTFTLSGVTRGLRNPVTIIITHPFGVVAYRAGSQPEPLGEPEIGEFVKYYIHTGHTPVWGQNEWRVLDTVEIGGNTHVRLISHIPTRKYTLGNNN
ncbi:MAG: hypothetical protein FWC68_03490 [Oscillospiraceae bacterium]|nr:hypothetical protein [Oscillospiraceae bacterium]